MKRFVPRGRNSVDVGANVGVHAYFLARWSRHVYAFEPNPRLAKYLERATSENVSVAPIALSDSGKTSVLSIPVRHGIEADPYASLEPQVANLRASADDQAVKEVEVELAPLDSLGLVDLGFLKVDVEGHELAVLRGGQRTIARDHPTLLVELDQRYLDRPLDEITREISSLGYDAFFMLGHDLRSIREFSVDQYQASPLADAAAGPFVENFFFFPRCS